MVRGPVDILDDITKSVARRLAETPIARLPPLRWAYVHTSKFLRNRRFQHAEVPEKTTYRGKQFYVFPETEWAKQIHFYGYFKRSDDSEASLFDEFVARGDTVFDVGAFVGTHTVMLREIVGETGQVYAFEPQPQCTELLEKTIAANEFTNCTVVNAAVGDETGTYQLGTAETPDTTSNVVGSDPWEKHERIVTVDAIRLDEFLDREQIDRVDFLKIDVQGAGLQVLEGLGARLTDVSKIYMEIHSKYIDDPRDFVKELFELLDESGEIVRLDTDERTRVETADELVYQEKHPTILWRRD